MIGAVVISACAGAGSVDPGAARVSTTVSAPSGPQTGEHSESVGTPGGISTLSVDLAGTGRVMDERLLGTNVPAWLGSDLLADEEFRTLLRESGATVVRMPGGSWSNYYDWLGCELGDEATCVWPWAARPSDFLDLIADSGLSAMWTVSANGTPQEAAALVAFFNGHVDDDRRIGEDARGRDWQTVGRWASLRAASGHPDPVPVELWEVGNEVFAATPDAGPECASFGWEAVWTCDGEEYVEGGEGGHGFLEFRSAMLDVDRSIEVGAVGVPDAESWGEWGSEVLGTAGLSLDFYVIHHYAYSGRPDVDGVAARAITDWAGIVTGVADTAAQVGLDRAPPIAVTEYNVVANQDEDADGVMATQVAAIHTAITIGQLAEHGVPIANHWNFANGRAENGTDYGMTEPTTLVRNPSYYSLAAWSRIGRELLDVDLRLEHGSDVVAYAGRRTDGAITILVVNATETEEQIEIAVPGVRAVAVDVVSAPALDARTVEFNGSPEPPTRLPWSDLEPVDDAGPVRRTLPPASISVFTVEVADA